MPPTLSADLAVIAFLGVAAAAAFSDVRSLTIPNRYCLAIVLIYPIYVVTAESPVAWTAGLVVAGVVLAAGFLLFALGRMGGGDAKLLAAVSLWAGTELLLDFLLLTALAGGVMALFLWLNHRWSRSPSLVAFAATQASPEFARQPMPYGLAVFVGAVYVAFTLLGLV